MITLECQKDYSKFSYKKCAECTSRECEQAKFDEYIQNYKELQPENKTWQSCVICGHARGLEVFEERHAHPQYSMFCNLHQRYIKTRESLCGYHCL